MKEFKFGNATVIIHSPLVHMSSEERRAWYQDEMAKGNPVLKEIAQAVNDSYIKRMTNATKN
ncbi:hypothetical protein [Neobacillus mesonae]|uniref:Uncharacterized protein n=1 Tax=Neobacillus mesonae TaxID=1193713 RepID=A0A3T0HV55_9BACI|nr:hypothetical protein [Neobacillus mesonae]AZU61009.1 hypothetical protein CHR53_06955 [Neobacillus mesonae]